MDDLQYKKKRSKNNEAVKRSRAKTREQTKEMMTRVERLRNENAELTEKIKLLQKELGLLKQLFIEHAGNSHGLNLTQEQLRLLQSDSDAEKLDALTRNS